MTAQGFYLIEGVNPEPWEAAEGSVGRRGGKLTATFHTVAKQRNYQQAMADEFRRLYGEPLHDHPDVNRVDFYFWREVETYETPSGKKSRARSNYADATNLQKATEDALQKILYDNDRVIVRVSSAIMDQGPGVAPAIMVVTGYSNIALELSNITKAREAMAETITPPPSNVREDVGDVF